MQGGKHVGQFQERMSLVSAPEVTRGFTSKYDYDHDALTNFLGGLF